MRLLHFWRDRVGGLVAVNCKVFAEGVLESKLLGHEKAPCTGATAARALGIDRTTLDRLTKRCSV